MSTEPCTLIRHVLNGATMGTRYSAILHGPENLDLQRIGAELATAVGAVDDQMSTWKPHSALNEISRAPLHVWLDVPVALMVVLEASLAVNAASGGLFDIGVGDLVSAWGFGGGETHPAPGRIVEVAAHQPGPVLKTLELDAGRCRLHKHAPMTLDLSAIAKGFGVDELGRVLDENGIDSWLVGIDGDMRAKGRKPDGSLWTVAHERPVRGAREAMGVFELDDKAVATSGAYRHFVDTDSGSFSHTMHPVTRHPVANEIASVSVLAETAMMADAWSTVLMVAGPEEGMALARRLGMSCIMVLKDESMLSTFAE